MFVIKYISFLTIITIYSTKAFCSDTLVIKSIYIPGDDSVLVYHPSEYPLNNERLPAIYLLHGLNGNYKSWGSYVNLQLLADQYNCIFICPDGMKDLYYLNSPKDSTIKYIDFFYKDLIPCINLKYKIDTTKTYITGNSMGGYGSLLIYLNKPECFLAAGSISGLLDLQYSANKDKKLMELIGNYEKNKIIFQKLSINYMIDSIDIKNYNILINCGKQDQFYDINKIFVEKSMERDANIYYEFTKGEHNKEYWKEALLWQLNVLLKKIF